MVMQRYAKFREEIASHFSPQSATTVNEALKFADERLSGVFRYDGSAMLDHGVEVARIVMGEIGLGRNSTVASIIHDVVRIAYKRGDQDSLVELAEQVRTLFGEEVLGIVTSLSMISGIKVNAEAQQAAAFRDLIISYSSDPRVILIKMADRLEVMRSLEIFPQEKWRKKSWESLNLYAQIAHKLGLYGLKSELEDISLKFLDSDDYNHIAKKLADSQAEREAFIKEFIAPLSARLDAAGVKYHIKSRTKSIYSIWTKMRKQNTPFEGVYDIFAIRIIIDCPDNMEKQQCWLAYSFVSDCYTPNPKRMKDWISIPKSNGYESLHATVSAGGKWVEVQIRSERMDMVAERGIAAHWRYKGHSAQGSDEWLSRLRELIEDTTESIADRFDAMPTSSEIFVFTPNGDIRKLPKGATVLDFAFDIHTRVGSTCVGAKINERSVPIRELLKSGDIVEVLTQKNQSPKSDWLNVAVTSKARNRIKYYLREESAKSAKDGKEELERRVKNWKLSISIDEAVAFLCKYYKVKSGTEVYQLIAEQRVDMLAVKELLQRYLSGEIDSKRRAAAAEAEQKKIERKQETKSGGSSSSSDALIIDEGINNIEYKLAKCCNPIKGDDVFGFVTVSTGITIHRKDCPNAARLIENYPYRVMEAAWRASATGAFRVNINIVIRDNSGVTNSVTEVISRELKLNMRGVSILSRPDGTAAGTISVEVPNTQTVDIMIHALQRLRDVIRVSRSKS